jgi:hypothetical protein
LSFAFVLLPILALGIDAGNLYYAQRQLQTFADAAAMAASLEIPACVALGTPKCPAMVTAANYAFTTENRAPAGATLTISNGPSALASDPNFGNTKYVEAIVTMSAPTYFAKVFGNNTVTLSARAEAGYSVAGGGNGLGMNTNNLTLNGGGSITETTGSTCGINDNAGSGLSTNAGVTVSVNSFTYHGSSYNKNCGSCTTYNPLPTTNAPVVSDPYASLTAPSQPNTSTTNVSTISGNTELKPGYYSNTINFNSGTYTVTLDPGLYYFGSGFNINSNVTITGTGVTLFFGSGANVNINSAATWNLTAPTSAITTSGDACASCSNMLIWDPSGSLNLDASSSSSFGGVVYLPQGTLTLNGGSSAVAYGPIYANNIMLDSAIAISCSGGGNPNGSPHISLAE